MSASYDWHNYGNLPIGARSDIEGVPIERLQAFYQTYYQPDNALLLVAGKFDEAKTLDAGAAVFRLDPETHAHPAGALHRRAGAGRRAARDPATQRATCSSPWSAITSPRARMPTSRRCRSSNEVLGRFTRRAGCTRRWSSPARPPRSCRSGLQNPRSGHDVLRRAGARRSATRAGARADHRRRWKNPPRSRSPTKKWSAPAPSCCRRSS